MESGTYLVFVKTKNFADDIDYLWWMNQSLKNDSWRGSKVITGSAIRYRLKENTEQEEKRAVHFANLHDPDVGEGWKYFSVIVENDKAFYAHEFRI